jgi:cardiolipin hydrolase
MKRMIQSVRSLFVLMLASVAIVSLFRHPIAHAIDAHPLLSNRGNTRPELHFSPDEDLERFDAQQLRQARSSIDISMYSFTDRFLAAVLRELAQRGVAIRLYRDQEQVQSEQLFARNRGGSTSALLHGLPSIQIRVKRGSPRALMHQKDYCVDGKCLREGSANWSPGAEKAQDNCVWFTTDTQQIAAYERKFAEMWNRSSNLVVQ